MMHVRPYAWYVAGILAVACVMFGAFVFASSRDDVEERIADCLTQGKLKEQCLNNIIVEEAIRRGVDRGLDALAHTYDSDPSFVQGCHGATHELGRIAFDAFEAGEKMKLSDKTSYCGFGFFHGFLEALLEKSGDLAEARRFCEYVDVTLKETFSGISFACYHGIGHGLVDGSDPATWGDEEKFIEPGLTLCNTLGDDDQHRERCASGVFNSLAIAYVTPKFRIAGDPLDPYAACRKQEKPYAQKACHDQMNGYVANTNPEFSEALKIAAEGAEPGYTIVAVQSVAGFLAKKALFEGGDLSQFVRGCAVVPEQLRETCVRGFAVGFIEFAKPTEKYHSAVDACAGSGVYASACMNAVATAVKESLAPSEQVDACTYVRERSGEIYGSACFDIIKEG
jgi:hypothetical protein